jgi:hypothetical protein
MFEEELELEKQEGGGFGPLIIIFALVAILVGGVGFVIWQNSQTLKPEDAAKALAANFDAQGPAFVHFHSGLVSPSVEDKISDPHYKLLQKAGILTTKPVKGKGVQVDLTAAGEKEISSFPDFKKTKEADGTYAYSVPLAQKELVKVDNVTKISPSRAQVEYTWKWKPNELGAIFDASGPTVKSFNTWDRSTLIQKYGADFYSADPQKITVILVKGANGWKPATE